MYKLPALRENPYESLLLDFALPGMHGLEVAEIAASSQTIMANNMRVIMLGSIGVHRSIVTSPHVHGFTTKPIRRLPLIKMIVQQIKIKRGTLGQSILGTQVAPLDTRNRMLPSSLSTVRGVIPSVISTAQRR